MSSDTLQQSTLELCASSTLLHVKLPCTEEGDDTEGSEDPCDLILWLALIVKQNWWTRVDNVLSHLFLN